MPKLERSNPIAELRFKAQDVFDVVLPIIGMDQECAVKTDGEVIYKLDCPNATQEQFDAAIAAVRFKWPKAFA